jgi:hypothetical protein
MLAMLSNRCGGQKENKCLDAMNDGVPIMARFAQATSNKKNITCLNCGKKGHCANECPNTPTVVAAAQVAEDDDSNDDDNKPHVATPSHARGNTTSSTHRYAWHGPTKYELFDPSSRSGFPNKAATACGSESYSSEWAVDTVANRTSIIPTTFVFFFFFYHHSAS